LDVHLRTEFLNLALGLLLHVFSELINVRARHIVGFAVVPDKLDLSEEFFVSGIFILGKVFLRIRLCKYLNSGKVHGLLHDLGVVKQPQL
jgi:hypothetical protein